MSINDVSRRHFFFGTLLAGAVPLGGYGSVPSLRALGYKPFYDKLNVASIGCGGQGGVDLNEAARTENIVAMCDVDQNRAAANLSKFEKVPKYTDFRVMLDNQKDIDACTIGIPDFMHWCRGVNSGGGLADRDTISRDDGMRSSIRRTDRRA